AGRIGFFGFASASAGRLISFQFLLCQRQAERLAFVLFGISFRLSWLSINTSLGRPMESSSMVF
ncbi:MAG: hypothetical protein WCI46_02860, partial [Verrucomicrobiota bacterium]